MFYIEKTYTDFNGNDRTEKFYFNLTEAECLEMMYSEAGGLEDYIQRIISAQDQEKILAIVKDLILRAYGEKSPDGREFMKNDDIRARFAATEAYSDIYMELGTDAEKLTGFFEKLIPTKLRKRVSDYVKAHPEDENAAVALKQLSE